MTGSIKNDEPHIQFIHITPTEVISRQRVAEELPFNSNRRENPRSFFIIIDLLGLSIGPFLNSEFGEGPKTRTSLTIAISRNLIELSHYR